MSREQPTYEAARIVAPTIEEHFADHHGRAVSRGETDLAPGPDASTAQAIIDASFWASFRREEGQFPKISIAYVSPEQVVQPLLFETKFDLITSVLTKLAPAVERPGVHLGVWPYQGRLQIWGALRSLPSLCFVLEVVEPGLLVVKHRRIDGFGKFANVAILKGEQIKIVDEKGTSQRLRELIGQLVEDNEGKNFERARPGQKTEKRLPHGVAQRSRGWRLYFRLGRLPGDEQHRQIDEGQYCVDDRPADARGHTDREAARREHRCTIHRDARS